MEMTQPQLARAAGLGLSTIVDFERSRREISQNAADAVRRALHEAGVEFIQENGGGPGIRLKARQLAKITKMRRKAKK